MCVVLFINITTSFRLLLQLLCVEKLQLCGYSLSWGLLVGLEDLKVGLLGGRGDFTSKPLQGEEEGGGRRRRGRGRGREENGNWLFVIHSKNQ